MIRISYLHTNLWNSVVFRCPLPSEFSFFLNNNKQVKDRKKSFADGHKSLENSKKLLSCHKLFMVDLHRQTHNNKSRDFCMRSFNKANPIDVVSCVFLNERRKKEVKQKSKQKNCIKPKRPWQAEILNMTSFCKMTGVLLLHSTRNIPNAKLFYLFDVIKLVCMSRHYCFLFSKNSIRISCIFIIKWISLRKFVESMKYHRRLIFEAKISTNCHSIKMYIIFQMCNTIYAMLHQ